MSFKSKKLTVLEANLDNMNPEWCEHLMERLFEAGALDVWFQPVFMKKNRPGFLAGVLAESRHQNSLLKILFEESTTLGVRSYDVKRFELDREVRNVRTPIGPVEIKIGKDKSGKVLNAAPEYESCKRLAKKRRVPLKQVYQAALKALKP